MRKLYHIMLLITMCISAKNLKAQLPSNDSAWVKVDSLSDDFNGSALNYTKWDTTWHYVQGSSIYNVANGGEWAFGKNDSVAGGYLYIKSDTLKPNKVASWGTFPDEGYGTYGQSLTYAYQGGVAQARSYNYLYGYIEAKIKYPSHLYPLWPAFWMFGGGPHAINEIDIAELSAPQVFQGNHAGNNYCVNFVTGSYNDSYIKLNPYGDITLPVDSLSAGYYRFGYECNPGKLAYYFENNPTTVVYDTSIIPRFPMNVRLSIGISPWYAYLPNDWNGPTMHFPDGTLVRGNGKPTKWPTYMSVDYLYYYKLKTDCSNSSLIICTPTDYDRKVKKSIKVGGSCSPNYNPADWNHSYTLRATDYVLIDVPTGTNATTINSTGTGYFAIDITPCPQ